MPIAALDPLETWLTGTENVRSSGVDQKSLVYGQNDATDRTRRWRYDVAARTRIRFLRAGFWPEIIRSFELDQSRHGRDEPHISISSWKARKVGSFNLHDIDADQCTNERLLKNYIKLLRE
jgi:hypothetical protein